MEGDRPAATEVDGLMLGDQGGLMTTSIQTTLIVQECYPLLNQAPAGWATALLSLTPLNNKGRTAIKTFNIAILLVIFYPLLILHSLR